MVEGSGHGGDSTLEAGASRDSPRQECRDFSQMEHLAPLVLWRDDHTRLAANMKFSLLSRFVTVAAAALTAGIAAAGTYTFSPSDKDLADLDHYYAYQWGFDLNVPAGEVITGATLKIKNIYDWTKENNDILNITMLDDPAKGIKTYYDNQGGGDFFAGKGVKVGSWTDPIGGYARNVNLEFNFEDLGLLDDLNKFAADGRLGFGFDPDCHYFNDGVYFTVHTAPVPEPMTMTLLAAGGVAALIRRRRMAKKA